MGMLDHWPIETRRDRPASGGGGGGEELQFMLQYSGFEA
jgi:hypothetical protein